MTKRDAVITVHGSKGALAADAAALGLMAAGASVRFPGRENPPLQPDAVLRGASVEVRVSVGGGEFGATTASPDGLGFADMARVGIGVILLLALLGAEVRLHFGPRIDTILTLAGIWIFWRHVGRRDQSLA